MVPDDHVESTNKTSPLSDAIVRALRQDQRTSTLFSESTDSSPLTHRDVETCTDVVVEKLDLLESQIPVVRTDDLSPDMPLPVIIETLLRQLMGE